MKRIVITCWLTFLGLFAGSTVAAQPTLESLLAQPVAPPGVVFEIVDRDAQALELALPWVEEAARKLRARFQAVPMAVVTHGQEMFALQSSQQNQHSMTHQRVQNLAKNEGIPVHVCETYAGWRGSTPEDFPTYVNVAASGPSQLRNYEMLDYVRLVVPGSAKLR